MPVAVESRQKSPGRKHTAGPPTCTSCNLRYATNVNEDLFPLGMYDSSSCCNIQKQEGYKTRIQTFSMTFQLSAGSRCSEKNKNIRLTIDDNVLCDNL